MNIDYRAYPVLFVDDETANLVSVKYALDEEFTILTASSGDQALEIIGSRDVAVLITDQRMPGMTGVELCEQCATAKPEMVRILITAYTDLHAAVEAINRGQIARYITKPFRNDEIANVMRTSIELVHIQRAVRDMEVRLLRSEQTSTASVIRGEVAHELNNVLGCLSLCVQQLGDYREGARRSLRSDPNRAEELLLSQEEALIDTRAAVEQLSGMVNRLRRGADPPKALARCDLSRVVDSTVRLLRTEVQRTAEVRVVIESEPVVGIEPSALGQVVMNLLLNAIQAMDPHQRESNGITLRVGSEGAFGTVQISDNGRGIPVEIRERVFDPYFTTKETGSGLGLAIVQELLNRAGGSIQIDSVVGRGTTVSLNIPRLDVAGAPGSAAG